LAVFLLKETDKASVIFQCPAEQSDALTVTPIRNLQSEIRNKKQVRQNKYNIILVLIILVLLIRIASILFEQKFWSDQQVQIIGAVSLLDGKGVTLPFVNTGNPEVIDYKTINQFPEGYSYLFAGAYFLAHNIYWAAVIIDFLSLLLYLCSWLVLFKLFKDQLDQNSHLLFLVFTGFSMSPFLFYTATDFLALSVFFFASVLILFSILQKNLLCLILSSILLAVSSWIRYSYYPLVFLFPILILMVSLYQKKKWQIIVSLSMLASIFITFLFFQLIKTHSGVLPDYVRVHQQNSRFVFFPGNLLKFNYVFALQPFIDTRSIFTITKYIHLQGIESILKFLFSASFLIITLNAVYEFSVNSFKNRLKEMREKETFIISLFFIAITSLCILMFLSFISPAQNNDILINWTFVQEPRYFSFIYVVLLFFALIVFNNYNNWFSSLLVKIQRVFLLSFAAVSILYYLPSTLVSIKTQPYYFQTGEKKFYNLQTEDLVFSMCLKEKISLNKLKGLRTVFISGSRTSNLAVILGAVFGTEAMLTNFKPDRFSALLLLQDKDSGPGLLKFIESNKFETVYKSNSLCLYQYLP
jgi:hypothetical protein